MHGTCCICFEHIEQERRLVVLECNHKFHLHCIGEWLIEKYPRARCPMCNVMLATSTDSTQYTKCPVRVASYMIKSDPKACRIILHGERLTDSPPSPHAGLIWAYEDYWS